MLKKLKNKKVLVIAAIFLFLLAGGAGAFFLTAMKNKPVETNEDAYVESELYWNADREQYLPKLGGKSTRKPEKDGMYTIRFMVNGEFVEYRVKDKQLMFDIDSQSIMGLLVDEDGFITEVVDLDRMGVREVSKSCYVQDIEGTVVKVNTSAIGDGVEVTLNIKEGTPIWNVTSAEHLGTKTELQTLDCVRAFNKQKGGITDIFVVSREDELTGVPVERYCEHCKQVVKWRMWIADGSLPTTEGHWRFIRDINMKKQHSMAKDLEQIFDLNGKVVTATHKSRIISLHNEGCKLSIMDSSEEKTGTLKGLGDGGGYGSLVWLRYDGVFDLYSGTLDASETISYVGGTAIQLNDTRGVFNMYGGTIIGGIAQAKVNKNEETGEEKFTTGYGGAIFSKGTVNMYDGKILDGKSIGCKNSKGTAATVGGGNIFLLGGSTFNMYGGLISGGTVEGENQLGGNLRILKNAVFNMHGGVIEKGACLSQGGNIVLYGTLNMSGGTIRDGRVLSGKKLKGATYNENSLSHNIFCVNGTINMTGGLIEGYVRILDDGKKPDGTKNECTVKISGTAKIKGGKTNLSLNAGDTVDFGKLKKGAAIYTTGVGYVSTETIASNREYVHSDYGVEVKYENKKLLIGKLDCVCGQNHVNENGNVVKEHFGKCDGTVEMWMPWTNGSQLPTKEGNWYLISDVNPTRQFTVAANTKMKLDLNGYRVYGLKDTRVYSLRNDNVEFVLTDLSDKLDGKIVANGDGAGIGYGNCFWVSGKSNFVMYNGTLDASKVVCKQEGTTVAVSKNCGFTMYGGTIIGGNTKSVGGAVSVAGKFDMYDGVIKDGYSQTDGGNLFVLANAEANLYGGKITDGEAKVNGGNIGSRGKLNILGGEISYGLAEMGGNICSYKTMTMADGIVLHGVARNSGNIFMAKDSTFVMSGGTVTQGVAQVSTGGNLRSIVGCAIEISGGTIENGIAETNGGNIWMNGGTLKLTGGAIKGGRALEGTGGNIYTDKIKQADILESTKLVLAGGSIQEGRAAVQAGNVYAKLADVTLAGNIAITDGTVGADKQASNLYLPSGIVAKLDGLSSEASIGITSEDSTFATNANADKSDVIKFISDDTTSIAQSKDNDLFVGKIGCMCGGHRNDASTTVNEGHENWCTADMRDLEWHAWRKDTSLPSKTHVGKNYYLTKDVVIKGQYQYENGTIGIDLNGHKVTQTSVTARIFALWNTAKGITLNITDTSVGRQGTLGFKEGLDMTYDGALIWMRSYSGDAEHVVNLYAGTLNGENISSAPVYVQKGSLSAFGGTIEGEVLLEPTNGAQLNVSGSPKVGVEVSDDKSQKHGVTWTATLDITANQVEESAEIILTNVSHFTLSGTGEGSAFKTQNKYNQIGDDNPSGIGNLQFVAKMCVCGANDGAFNHTPSCKQPDSPWQPWNAAASQAMHSGTVRLPRETGSYYLTEDFNELKVYTDLAAGKAVNLDLAGHKVEGPGSEGLLYRTNGGSLNITDTSEEKTGAIIATGANTSMPGRVVYVWGNSSNASCVNLFAGKLGTAADTTGKDGVVVKINNGVFNMYGGEITPGTCVTEGGSNCVAVGYSNKNAVLNVQGGTIKGEVKINTTYATVKVAGNAKVGIEAPEKAYGIVTDSTITTAVNLTCEEVSAEGQVVLKNTGCLQVVGTGDERAFTIIDPHNKVVDNSGGDGVGELSYAPRMCVCGSVGEHTQVGNCAIPTGIWEMWNEEISKAMHSNSVRLPRISGNYYLTGDMTLTTYSDIGRATSKSEIINVDMAGHTATMPAGKGEGMVLRLTYSSVLNIADSVGGGKIESLYEGDVYGGIVYLWQNTPKVNVYNVALEATKVTAKSNYSEVVHRTVGNFAMYGGSIKGNPNSSGASIRSSNTSNINAGINLKNVLVDGVNKTMTNW